MAHLLTGALDVLLVTQLRTAAADEVDRNMIIKSYFKL
jgi:hypothetical protein